MRLKMFSPYDHFPHHNPIDGEPYIPCYNDHFIFEKNKEPNAVALLIEPRSLVKQNYEYIENHPDEFKLVFTHDSILLSTLPNARQICFGGVYSYLPEGIKKIKNISFCSSDKEYCYIHKLRKQLAKDLEGMVDCMGTYNGGQRVSTYDIYGEYKFSIVIENYIDDIWFTEKICNAFANKCVPIYYGAREIDKLFDGKGIVKVNKLYDLPKIIKRIKYDIDWEYDRRKDAIETNYQRVKKYEAFERWFFKTYEKELDGLAK